MNPHPLLRFALHCTALLLLLASCKGPETIVVTETPTVAADTAATGDTTATEPRAAFRHLVIGEINEIPSLDPLFADNAATMRAIQLLHEGLLRYDGQERLVAGLAGSWKVSDDSLTYRFTLRPDAYFHDSNIFNAGVGRKVVARDVKYVFERMARMEVPPAAAKLFMPVKGFQPYFREQRHIYNPEHRALKGVGGITVANDSTVIFRLVEKDPRFLHKLASPYASIYPREAVAEGRPSAIKAVGAGPFSLSRQRGDSLYIFAKFKNYYEKGAPVVNRVDVRVQGKESELFRSFNLGEVHLVPELGLQTMRGVLSAEGELSPAYAGRYRLYRPGGQSRHTLLYNPGAALAPEKVQALYSLADSTIAFPELPTGLVHFTTTRSPADSASFFTGGTLTISRSTNAFSNRLTLLLGHRLKAAGADLQQSPVRIPTRTTELYYSHHLPLYPGDRAETSRHELLHFTAAHLALAIPEIRNLHFNSLPWWIDLRSLTLPPTDTF